MQKEKILLVDHEPRWIAFARQDLADYEVLTVGSEAEALQVLDTEPVRLIFTTNRQLGLVAEIKARYPEKRIAVMTMRPNVAESVAVYKAGGWVYFTRSFQVHQLAQIAQRLLGGIPS